MHAVSGQAVPFQRLIRFLDSIQASAWGLGAALLLTVVGFGASLANGFVWDDHYIVVPAQAYRSFDLAAIFLEKANALEYLPVRDLTLALDSALWNTEPFGFHLTNLLLYLLSVALVYRVVRRLAVICEAANPRVVAFWTTLIFALHPLHVEAVNFITARNNIVAMLFLLLSLDLFIAGVQGQTLRLVFSLLAFILAVLSKASAVFFPIFLLALVVLTPIGRRGSWPVGLVMALFVVVDALAIWGHVAVARETGVMNSDVLRFGAESLSWNLFRAAQIPFFYARYLLMPYPLSVAYPEDFLGGFAALGGLGTVAGSLVAFAIAWKRRSLLAVLGMLWFLSSLGPVLNLFPTSPVVADRYAYPAVLGFGLVAACALQPAWRRDRRILPVAWLVVLAWCALDIARSRAWSSDLTLFASAYALYPDAARDNYAKALLDNGRTEEALALLAQEDPPSFKHPLLQGSLLASEGRHAEAAARYREALRLGGQTEKSVHVQLAQSLEAIGDADGALRHYLDAIEAPSMDPLQRHTEQAGAGVERMRQRLAPRRMALAENARSRPEDFRAHFELALFLHSIGEYEQSTQHYLRAAEIDPSPWQLWYNLGLVKEKQRRHREAAKAFRRSLEQNPDHAHTLNHLAIAHRALGDHARAIRYFRRALEADETFIEAALNLGRLYFRRGDRQRAEQYLKLARRLAGGDRARIAQIDHVLGQVR